MKPMQQTFEANANRKGLRASLYMPRPGALGAFGALKCGTSACVLVHPADTMNMLIVIPARTVTRAIVILTRSGVFSNNGLPKTLVKQRKAVGREDEL